MSFPCTQCGECCRRVSQSPATAPLDRGDGTCRHFDDDARSCRIYEERPALCRIDEGFETTFKLFMSKERYYAENAEWCNRWQEEKGLPESFRVRL